MSYDAKPPMPYEVEKLARMTKTNRAELEAIQALRAEGKPVPRRRVIVLMRNVKLQGRLEKELARRAEKAAPARGAGSTIERIAAEAREAGK